MAHTATTPARSAGSAAAPTTCAARSTANHSLPPQAARRGASAPTHQRRTQRPRASRQPPKPTTALRYRNLHRPALTSPTTWGDAIRRATRDCSTRQSCRRTSTTLADIRLPIDQRTLTRPRGARSPPRRANTFLSKNVIIQAVSDAMTVRPARPGDEQAIAEVHVRTWQAAYRGQVPDKFLDELSIARRTGMWRRIIDDSHPPANQAFVLEENQRVVGFAHVTPSRDHDADGDVGELTAIYVLRESWRAGGGRMLLDHALAGLSAAGFSAATLWVLGPTRAHGGSMRRWGGPPTARRRTRNGQASRCTSCATAAQCPKRPKRPSRPKSHELGHHRDSIRRAAAGSWNTVMRCPTSRGYRSSGGATQPSPDVCSTFPAG